MQDAVPSEYEVVSPNYWMATPCPPFGSKFTEDTKEGNRKVKAALAMRAKGVGYRKIAKEVGLGVGTVMRLTASHDINHPFEDASTAVA